LQQEWLIGCLSFTLSALAKKSKEDTRFLLKTLGILKTINAIWFFTLSIRDIKDNDGARVYVERYAGCTLDPSSPNYLAKKIGDRYYEWNEAKEELLSMVHIPNVSNIVRVANGTMQLILASLTQRCCHLVSKDHSS
jgi:hypothetical protein